MPSPGLVCPFGQDAENVLGTLPAKAWPGEGGWGEGKEEEGQGAGGEGAKERRLRRRLAHTNRLTNSRTHVSE